MKTYITLTALNNYIDIKELTVGEELILEKDKENQYDDEAIKVMGANHSKRTWRRKNTKIREKIKFVI